MKKTFVMFVLLLTAIVALSVEAKAYDADAEIGSAIYMDDKGITHTSDGLAWGPDGVVYEEADTFCFNHDSLGSAIWMDANGITHTSDGLAWGPDGIVYEDGDIGPAIWMIDGIVYTSDGDSWVYDDTAATWVDDCGIEHSWDHTCIITATRDENGQVSLDVMPSIDFGVPVSVIVTTGIDYIQVQILDLFTNVEILVIVINID